MLTPIVFLSAGGVSIIKVLKTYALLFEKDGKYTLSTTRKDPFKGGLVCALNSVEVSCTIIAASIPFFRPLIRRLMTKNNNGRATPEDHIAMRSLPFGCRGDARLGSPNGFCRATTPKDDDSIAILEFERKL